MLALASPALDTYDPLSTVAIECTVTDALAAGAAVPSATVTATITRADGTALAAPLNAALTLTHVGSGLYRRLIPPADSASAGIVVGTVGQLRIDYTAAVSGTSPLVSATVRQRVTVARRVDP